MKILTSPVFSLLLVSALAVPVVSAESVRMTESAHPDGAEVANVSRAVVLSEDAQQKASGELAITNIDGYTFALDLSALSIFDLCVRNYRGTAASDVWVEVWASNQIPQIGSDLTHQLVAKYGLSLVQGYSTRCADTGALPMTPPNPGLYWLSIVLYEGSGSGRTLQFIYTDPEKGDVGGPFGS